MLRPRTIAEIENAFRDGLTIWATMYLTDCGQTSVGRLFREFRAERVPRIVRKRRSRSASERGAACYNDGWPPPYTGPAWIGKAADHRGNA